MKTKSATEDDSILVQLKSRTAHRHQQTEDGVDLMSNAFSLADYRNLLVRFYSFYEPFEAEMRRGMLENEIDLDYAERLNTPRLKADLEHLGMSEAEISAVKFFRDVPLLGSKEKIYGALYVIEGSTLGGQVISRHLKEKFHLDETNGASFFSGYGKETGKMWNAFREKITAFAETSENHEEIIESADATFEKIGRALAESDL